LLPAFTGFDPLMMSEGQRRIGTFVAVLAAGPGVGSCVLFSGSVRSHSLVRFSCSMNGARYTKRVTPRNLGGGTNWSWFTPGGNFSFTPW
jgi:hypothetical protein